MELREKVINELEEVMKLSEAANECGVVIGYGLVEDIIELLKKQNKDQKYIYRDAGYDDWSGAQGNDYERLREQQERAYWGVYG